MERLSPDEVFALVVFILLTLMTWGRMLLCALQLHARLTGWMVRFQALLLLPTVLALLHVFLRRYADAGVRDSTLYLTFYLAFGAAWTGVCASVFSMLGLSLRDDVLERANPAARLAAFSAIFAAAFCFAGSNIGDGPGWWVVLFCAALASGTLVLIWVLIGTFSSIRTRIILERDLTAARRLAGLLLACGVVLGRAAAGDWTTAGAAFTDFVQAARPAGVLLVIALLAEHLLPRATGRSDGFPGTGWPVMALYLGLGAYAVHGLGPW